MNWPVLRKSRRLTVEAKARPRAHTCDLLATDMSISMKIEQETLRIVVTPLLLSLIFTLYLAPSKHIFGDLLSLLTLASVISIVGVRASNIRQGLQPLMPLVALTLYALLFEVLGRGENNIDYIHELTSGFAPFLLVYVLLRTNKRLQPIHILLGAFILTGFVHIGYMYFDIWTAFRSHDIRLINTAGFGALESIKDAPRVGRRYLSMALIHLLFGSLLLAIIVRMKWLRFTAYWAAFVAILSLALIDARSAYFSLFGGFLIFLLIFGKSHLTKQVEKALKIKPLIWILLFLVIACSVLVAYNSGKSRWSVMSYSIQAAYTDVMANGDRTMRPFIDSDFWMQPIADEEECIADRHFRCKVDQSAYLRTAWVLEGLRSLIDEPWGIGYSYDYMARRWDVAGDSHKYQHIDSSTTQQAVTYGLVGLFLFGMFMFKLVIAAFSSEKTDRPAFLFSLMLILLILVYLVRSTFDLITDGAWRYLMTLMGMYYGLLHSSAVEPKFKSTEETPF